MAGSNDSCRYSIISVGEQSVISVEGINTDYTIGLGKDGSICSSRNGDEDIIVPLVKLSISSTGGLTLSPANKDLLCSVNGDVLRSEINVISGSVVDIADKKFQIIDGAVKKPKRKLPQTPGLSTSSKPPVKPRRSVGEEPKEPVSETQKNAKEEQFQGSWEVISHPEVDKDILANLQSPLELGSLAASFLTKQIHHYTDCRLSAKTTDQIFKFMQEVAGYQKGILMDYLTDTSDKLEEMPESERDRPIHRPVVKLLTELLRQILDPLNHVVLCLQLLRTFSHFPVNIEALVSYQATPAVLGCMAVYLDEAEVQKSSLDILAKIALYKPRITDKFPVRETGLELIMRALSHHKQNVEVVQAGCRTLSTLTTTMQDILETLLDIEPVPDVDNAIETYVNLLNHMFSESLQLIQNYLQEFDSVLNIKMEGRRFLFNYTKMTQLMIKKTSRKNKQAEAETINEEEKQTEAPMIPGTEPAHTDLPQQLNLLKVKTEEDTKGILKKDGSFTDIQDLERKVRFVDEKSVSSDDYTSSDSEVDDRGFEDSGPRLEVQTTKVLTPEELSAGGFGLTINDTENTSIDYQDNSESQSGSAKHTIEADQTYGDEDIEEALSNENDDSGNGDLVMSETDVDKKPDNNPETTAKVKPLLKHHSFTTVEVDFLMKSVYLTIVHYTSVLVFRGDEALALTIIDQPLVFLIEKSGGCEGLLKFCQEQYERSKTLMDIDPTFLISLIDAFRYKSLLGDLLQQTVLGVASGLAENHSLDVLHLSLSTLLNTIDDQNLSVVTTDKQFISDLFSSMKKSEEKLKQFPEIEQLSQKLIKLQYEN